MNIAMTIILWIMYFISLYFAVFWLIIFVTRDDDNEEEILQEFPFVSVTIPAYNEEKSIKTTIESVTNLEYPKDRFEVLVVSDGSTDNTESLVREAIESNKKYNIQLITQKNKGKGAALNKALNKAKGEFFVCLDADSFIDNDALLKMLPYFKDEKVAAVLPSLKVHKPEKLLEKLQWYEYIINMFYKELMGKLNCVHVAPGPFSVYRTSIIKEIGKFDENNITEDLEIALRLQYNDYKIVQVMNTEVTTLAPDTIKELYTQRNRWFKGALLNAFKYKKMMFNKKYGDFGFIQMPTIIFSGVIAITLVSTILYYGMKPYIEYLYNLRLVNFDFITFLKNININFALFDLNYVTVFIAVVMLTVTLYIMKKSEVRTNEKLLKYGSFGVIVYLIFYFLFLGIVWLGVLVDIARGKKQAW